MSVAARTLRARADATSAPLPALRVRAERLAATVVLGEHGRRRAGMGEEFWQYRQAVPGDAASSIDWRRSARSDATFIRQTEWSAAQTVTLWSDAARSMAYPETGETKGERAALLALSLAILLTQGGERVGHAAPDLRAGTGRVQLDRLTALLGREGGGYDYGLPPAATRGTATHVLFSDFLAPGDELFERLTHIGRQGERGVLVQILDESEEAFPFDGRTEFRSMGGAVRFETERARALRGDYRSKLDERRRRLATLARRAGWLFHVHHVQTSPRAALIWLHGALGDVR